MFSHARRFRAIFPHRRLPPYIFSITTSLKMEARRAAKVTVDSAWQSRRPTPKQIVEKTVEVRPRGDTHGYSASKGIPRLRRRSAISNKNAL
jgi:alanine-synthesizing transaminase